MTLTPARVPVAGVRRLTATLYGYAFLDEFVLLYPVYALLFADTGLSVWQMSSLFVLWSATGVLLEVPSGAWADAVSRRALLWLGPLLGAAGFALWVLVPSYWAFALGFVLWGARGALASGALEALVYEELERLGAASRYARIMGRAHAAGQAAAMTAMALSGPVFAAYGYPAVGAASVLACLLCAGVATRFPEHRGVGPGAAVAVGGGGGDGGGRGGGCDGGDQEGSGGGGRGRGRGGGDLGGSGRGSGDGEGGGHGSGAHGVGRGDGDAGGPSGGGDVGNGLGWVAVLRAGVGEARRDRSVRGALLLVPAVAAVWGALDEYTPLLARDTGVADATVPYLLVLIWAGVTAGSLLAGPAERLGRKGLAALLTASALALAVGAGAGTPAGIALVAVAFGGFQLATVLADVRLQQRIEGTGRATLTSLAGLATDLTTITVYATYATALTPTDTHAGAFVLYTVPYLVTAGVLALRRLRP
ncbi:MFS transporter [Streptomyces sp. NPDC002328]|uniref:MFS transporter n=1 Tax=Streptomyces sp. NPDC002328 TaxID=3364642 RepID=UPI00367CC1BF